MVERRIKVGGFSLTNMQKQTVQLIVSDLVAGVENRMWVESEVAGVLYGVVDCVAGVEAERRVRHGKKPFVYVAPGEEEEEVEVLPEGWARFETQEDGVWYENAETKDTAWEYPGQQEYLEKKRAKAEAQKELEETVAFGTGVNMLLFGSQKGGNSGQNDLGDYLTSTTVELVQAQNKVEEEARKAEDEEEKEAMKALARVDLGDEKEDSAPPHREHHHHHHHPEEKKEAAMTDIVAVKVEEPKRMKKGFGFGLTRQVTLSAARALVVKEDKEEADKEQAAQDAGKANRNAIGKVVGDVVKSKLSIDVFDADFGSKGDFLGESNVPFEILASTSRGATEMVTLELVRAEPGSLHDTQCVEKVSGTLGIILTPSKLNEETNKIEQWTLRIMEGRGLAKADLFGKSDPFCVVRWGALDDGKGSCINNTLDPDWGGGEKDTFQVPSEANRIKDEEATTFLKRTMKKTKALGDGMGMRGKLFGNMLKKGMLQVKMMAGMAGKSKAKIVDEVAERLQFWEQETVRQEMERRYLWREELRQQKLEEMRMRAKERPLRDEQESGHRAYLDIVNKCHGLRSSLLRYKWHKTLQMGSTHEMLVQVQDPSSGIFKVVKFLPCEYDEDCQRVLVEAEVVEDVSHKGVVRCQSVQRHMIQHFELNGAATQRWNLAIFVSEWCEGGKLIDLLRGVDYLDVSGRQMQIWCQQVAAGLRALHELNIVHRNLNPGNIYLDGSGKAKLGGFMCMKASRGPGCGFSYGRCDVGSPMIIAPEVDDGYEVTTKCDIWAFGCCMYYMCTGVLPDLRMMGVEAALKNVSLHFGERVRGAIRMALQVHPQVRSSAEEIWMYLSVLDVVKKKKKRALDRLRKIVGAKEGVDHGAKSKFGGLMDSIQGGQGNMLKLKLAAAKEAAKKTEAEEAADGERKEKER